MRTSWIGHVSWGLAGFLGAASTGCTKQPPCHTATCKSCDEPGDDSPVELTRAGEARAALALEISQGSLDAGGGLTWFAGPPDATTLYVHNLPICNELTLRGVAQFVEGPRGLRATGFTRVSCYPETAYAFDVPAEGDSATIEQPGKGDGWYCAIIDRQFDAGICLRDPGRCRATAATQNAEPTCEARSKAYCSSVGGEINCFTSAEACVHLSAEGSSACEVEY